MIAATWFVVGASFIIYLAGLKGIPQDLVDAAKIDGASFFKALRYVIWPMLTPATIVVIALQAMRAIKLFDLLFALTGGGPSYFTTVLGVLMYDVAFRRFHMGQGATVAIILFILAAIIISPYMIYSTRRLEEIQQ
jgi:ABC-type sugar transport system permease subunit